MYNLHAVRNPKDAFQEEDEDSVFEQIAHVADYVVEESLDNQMAYRLETALKINFGAENISRHEVTFRIKSKGVDYFFQQKKDWLINAVEKIKDLPAKQLMQFNLEFPGWWQIKNAMDDKYDSYYKVDDESWETVTEFAETIDYLCSTYKTDEITLTLRQVFNYHY
jgi:hypothetical protein